MLCGKRVRTAGAMFHGAPSGTVRISGADAASWYRVGQRPADRAMTYHEAVICAAVGRLGQRLWRARKSRLRREFGFPSVDLRLLKILTDR
jgi:hypothetical protein